MALVKKPVTGMKDIQPAEMQIRDYVIGLIKETYKGFGFTPIETPCVENIANLSNKQGGENEKLIFKILKRGEKLNLETAQTEADLVDSGLRYDLTVPLSRYYSNNAANLPKPFKALQIGPVWRADRPQKGRFRQFYQCDIDILGDPTNLAEIELILATTTLLGKVGFKGFTVHINDRRILKGMAKYSGFDEAQYDEVFIILDKMDKIGLDGVAKELASNGFAEESIERYMGLFKGLNGSIAGGGRYDKMVGKFTGMETPACGFSIGFERIVTILLDEGFTVPGSKEKIAYLVEKGVDSKVLGTVLQEAMAGRAAGQQILVAWMNKNKKFQKEQLTAEGYSEFKEFYKEALK